MKIDPIIERYRMFWSEASENADFEDMSKVLRNLVTYLKSEYNDVANHVELINELSDELDKYLPLMDLDQFCAASKAISYGKRAIRTSGSPTYASGLARDITEEERRELRESINASDQSRTEGVNGSGDDAGDDLLNLGADSDEH